MPAATSQASDFTPLTVAATREETDEAKLLVFDVPAMLRERFAFAAGQYLTLRDRVDGESVARSYSICSAEQDDTLRVAVKRAKGGRFSNHVNDHVQAGDTLDVMPPSGGFCLRPEDSSRYLFIAAGSGITPVLSLIKTALHRQPDCRVTLVYGNKSMATTMFASELFFIKNAYMDRFQWINIYSRQTQQNTLFNGRIDNRKGGELNERLVDIAGHSQFYLCGPESMISEVSRGLTGLGIDSARIHFELFSTSAEDARIAASKHRQRVERHTGETSELRLIHRGREHLFTLSRDGENILDAGIRHGADLPFSCKSGICATCKCRVRSGEVEMDIEHGLDAESIAQGYVLSCQSHPLSDSVTLDFDQA